MSKNIWVIVPIFNEARYIQAVLRKIKKFHTQILVVDDGSTDETAALVKREKIPLLRHRVNMGKGAAMKTGSQYAFEELGADAIIFLDGDDQHDPKELRHFVSKLRAGADLIFGIREMGDNFPWVKKFANRALSSTVLLLFGTYIPDIPSGFTAFSKRIYPQIVWQARGYEVETEIAVRTAKSKLPFDTVCIATIYHDMNKGMSFLDALKLVIPIITWKFDL